MAGIASSPSQLHSAGPCNLLERIRILQPCLVLSKLPMHTKSSWRRVCLHTRHSVNPSNNQLLNRSQVPTVDEPATLRALDDNQATAMELSRLFFARRLLPELVFQRRLITF